MTTRWGILATGRIAKTLADAVSASETGELVAVGSRSLASAEEFARNYEELTAHGSYQDLIDDPNVDALTSRRPTHSTPNGRSKRSKPARPSYAKSPWP